MGSASISYYTVIPEGCFLYNIWEDLHNNIGKDLNLKRYKNNIWKDLNKKVPKLSESIICSDQVGYWKTCRQVSGHLPGPEHGTQSPSARSGGASQVHQPWYRPAVPRTGGTLCKIVKYTPELFILAPTSSNNSALMAREHSKWYHAAVGRWWGKWMWFKLREVRGSDEILEFYRGF